jgi:hypothetical protein
MVPMDFRWEFADAAGAALAIPAAVAPGQRFPTQADAESWLGEFWPELVRAGAVSAVLHEGDRVVYGPMGLLA